MFHFIFSILGIKRRGGVRGTRFRNEVDIIRRIVAFGVYLWLLIMVHSAAMVLFEGLAFPDAVWLSVTTITTVGYGDYSASTFMGRAATVLLLYIGGIFLLAQIASDFVDYRITRRERINAGIWDWNMKDHILILNAPVYNSELYFRRIISQIRELPEYRDTPIEILTTQFEGGLPGTLNDLGVRHYHGSANNFADLQHVNVLDARHIMVLAKNEYDTSVDSVTFDVVHRLNELGVVERAFVECVDDDNRERLYKIGARVVLRPIRSYPEIVVRAMVAPGSEAIIEDFFTHEGDHPQRYEVELRDMPWHEVVSALIRADLGIAMGYVDHKQGKVVPNPPASTRVSTSALIILVRETNEPGQEQVRACLNKVLAQAS